LLRNGKNAQAAAAQLDLARAQDDQTKARLEELRVNLANTVIASSVDGFVARRSLDPGAWVATNSSFISVVDIGTVRMVANVAEKDIQHITAGTTAHVGVDAYAGETFTGRVARVAPVLDPATRTAQIEVEIPNSDYRLKPGMYARVEFTTATHPKVLTVPTAAVVNIQGKSGVFLPGGGNVAKFQPISLGLQQGELTEIVAGLQEGDRVVTTGAGALQDGDRIILPGQAASAQGAPGGGQGRAGRGARGAGQGQGTGGRRSGGANDVPQGPAASVQRAQ
jgi:RND family efflux transporter MFP subunit